MKPSKIYLKIFLSFLLILAVTEILIFGLFGIVLGRHLRSEMDRYVSTQVAQDESLEQFIQELGELLGAQVWLQSQDGEVLAQSFRGNVPKEAQDLAKGRRRDFSSFRLYHGRGRRSGTYAVVPIALQGGKDSDLHVFFPKDISSPPEGGFGLGLAVIGMVIALLVIPVSRFISRPINELRDSARRIAEGELSHRAVVKGKDEIGKLGDAFNHMADRLEKMIRGSKELTAHISHELRTPLTRIRIAEEILREKMEQQPCVGLDRYLDDIREDVEELDDLIGKILTLSKFDLKERTLSSESLDPVEMINGLLGRLKPAMDRKGLRLTTDVSFEPPFWGDPNAIHTAFSNILENAAKYSLPGGDVKVEMKAVEGALEVAVTNAADNVPEEELERIFEPFHRWGAKKESGFGLGLAMAKKIIEAHGGTIRAQNVEEGFRITIRLPHVTAKDAETAKK
jgi:two-component system sensor histidine kinase CpxA